MKGAMAIGRPRRPQQEAAQDLLALNSKKGRPFGTPAQAGWGAGRPWECLDSAETPPGLIEFLLSQVVSRQCLGHG